MQGLWDRSLSLRFFVLGATKKGGGIGMKKEKNISFLNPHLRVMCHGDATNKQHTHTQNHQSKVKLHFLIFTIATDGTHTQIDTQSTCCVREWTTADTVLLRRRTHALYKNSFVCCVVLVSSNSWVRMASWSVADCRDTLWARALRTLVRRLSEKGGACAPSRELSSSHMDWGEGEVRAAGHFHTHTRSTKCRLV